MNLRHTKPSYSYSESAPSIKISEIRVKQDPMVRYHAQLLLNFVQKANEKYQALQERLKASKNRRKSKGKNQLAKQIVKKSTQKTLIQSRQTISPYKYKNSRKQQKEVKQTPKRQLFRSTKKEDQFQFPIQFIQMLLSLYQQPQNESQTGLEFPNSSISIRLQKACQINPEYGPLLAQLYSQNYYIDGFHPNQLAFD